MEEEKIYTYSEVIYRVRRSLLEYIDNVAKVIEERLRAPMESTITLDNKGACPEQKPGFINKIGVVDGGSGLIALNIGYIGIVSAIGVVIEDNRVVERVVADPVIIPEDPELLDEFEEASSIESIIDKTREALVFETATRLSTRDLDLLIIDGPLAPYGALAKKTTSSSLEERAWERYRRAVLSLHGEAKARGLDVVGYVKRPRSTYIMRLNRLHGFDHVYLSRLLKPGEFYPDPPLDLSRYAFLFHDPEVAKLVSSLCIKTTYIRLQESTPPSRVDLACTVKDYKSVLSYLYATRTREGIPYPVMKSDEEAKLTRKLLKELYEDILHEYIVKYVKSKPYMLIPLLPEYGGV